MRVLTEDDIGCVVGQAMIPAGEKHTDSFETAAWFVEHEFVAGGPYPVELRAMRYGSAPVHGYSLLVLDAPTVVRAANLTSMFCGVGYGDNRAGRERIGQHESRAYCVAYSRTLEGLDLSRLMPLPEDETRAAPAPRRPRG